MAHPQARLPTPAPRLPTLTALLLLAAGAACDGGGPTPPEERVPVAVVPRGGDAQAAPVGSAVTIPPSVIVVDGEDRPVAGVEVVFTITRGGGTLSDPVQATGDDGIARVGGWTLGEMPGTHEITATAEGLPPAMIQATARVGAPERLVVVTPPPAAAPAGADVSPVPTVRVVDRFGNPVPQVMVRFEVVEGGGTVGPSEVATGAEGLASPGRWVLGADAGTQVLRASVDGVEAVFLTVDAVGGQPARAVPVQGDDQQGSTGETLPLAPAVRLEDELGNPVPGVAVTFTVVSGGGTVTPSVVTTDAQGVAEADAWTLGEEAGENVVEATAEGAEPVRFTANAVEGAPADLRLLAGDDQTAEVGTELPVRPAVRLLDGSGRPVAGSAIDFTVREGGGSVSPARVVTDENGVARTRWTLGPDPGLQSLEAAADGFDQVVFTATATPGAPATVTKVVGDGQGALTGGAVPVDPAVRVRDRFGNPVPDATVTFQAVSGGGSVSGGVVATGQDGIARVGAWRLGPTPGPNELRAAAAGADPVVFAATAVAGGRYDLEVRPVVPPTAAQQQALDRARDRWGAVLEGDLPMVQMAVAADACVEGQPALNETVDDLVIFVRFDSIDGPGRVLGSAGPCYVRSASSLPVVGVINLDEADLEELEARGLLEAVILHEMGHVLGVGTLWSSLDLLVGEGGPDPIFVGPAALDAWDAVDGPAAYAGTPVPVENTGGAGTRDGHWRESVLEDELMTGFVGRAANPLSVLTVASLADLGYVVDPDAADPFEVPLGVPPAAPAVEVELREAPLPPPVAVDERGRPVGGRR